MFAIVVMGIVFALVGMVVGNPNTEQLMQHTLEIKHNNDNDEHNSDNICRSKCTMVVPVSSGSGS